MVKNKTSQEASLTVKPTHHVFARFVFVAALIGVGYGVWNNPQIIDDIKARMNAFYNEKEDYSLQAEQLKRQISLLESRLERLSSIDHRADYNEMKSRVDAIEKINLNVIDSKADVSTVLGLINRMDKVEQKVDAVAEVTDESALILTATMLVKDAAERGGSFEYEAEVLQEIAKSEHRIKEPLSVIVRLSTTGIVSEAKLQEGFNLIIRNEVKEQKKSKEKTWKDRLNSKFGEFVQIKNSGETAEESESLKTLKQIGKYVNAGDISKAVEQLTDKNLALADREDVKNWLQQAQSKVAFNQAVSKISSTSLALMKVNFIRKMTRKTND